MKGIVDNLLLIIIIIIVIVKLVKFSIYFAVKIHIINVYSYPILQEWGFQIEFICIFISKKDCFSIPQFSNYHHHS